MRTNEPTPTATAMDSGVRSMADLIADYDTRVEQARQDEKMRFVAFSQNRLLDETSHDEYAIYMNDVMERVQELEAVRSWLLKYVEMCQNPSHKHTNMSIDERDLETRDAQRRLKAVERKLRRYSRALEAQDD